MRTTLEPRLRVPAVMAIGGSVIALASLIGAGWASAVSVEVFTVIATVGYYLLGARDTDLGALVGSRPDERQATVAMRASALAAHVMTWVALGGFVIATAVGASVWPFILFICVGAGSFLAGSLIFRAREA